ncbi:Clp protease N-terminal domain-containing protein [Streptomyces poriticola]|uniref:Clp protease N-terminal domain-containing protein n=1 Tax=Streptomyces poriticola TaxID=3120506 RepID=UPI002FCE04AD
MPELMTADAVRDLAGSVAEARSLGHSLVTPTHVLLSVASHRSPARGLLDAAGADHGAVRAALAARRPAGASSGRPRELPWSPEMERILHLSQSLTEKPFSSAHLLGLILDNDGECVALLEGCGVATAELRAAVATELGRA